MKTTIIGLGYVGLPLAILAKYKGIEVLGFDINEKKLEQIKNKNITIEDSFATTIFDKIDLKVSNKIESSDVYIVCVPTPIDEKNEPDLTPVIGATELISKVLEDNQLIVIESTIYPGLCEEIVKPILDKTGKKYLLSHCPERINPGDKKWNVANIPRVVGGIDQESTDRTYEWYSKVLDSTIVKMSSIKNAEATKILENIFRDVNIALINEMAQSFYRMDIDIMEVVKGASTKPFAFMAHYPGVGVGGHCIAVDPYYMIEKGRASGFDHELLRLARKINTNMPIYTIYLLQNTFNYIGLSLKNRKVGIYGLSYKPNVGDIRESPSLEIIKRLKELKGAEVIIYDPYVLEMSTVKNLDKFLSSIEALVVCTAHDEIKNIDYNLLKTNNIKIVIDGRNALSKEEIINKGIEYRGIGRK